MQIVTPCAGVWIEIIVKMGASIKLTVTPCAGVGIEIKKYSKENNSK